MCWKSVLQRSVTKECWRKAFQRRVRREFLFVFVKKFGEEHCREVLENSYRKEVLEETVVEKCKSHPSIPKCIWVSHISHVTKSMSYVNMVYGWTCFLNEGYLDDLRGIPLFNDSQHLKDPQALLHNTWDAPLPRVQMESKDWHGSPRTDMWICYYIVNSQCTMRACCFDLCEKTCNRNIRNVELILWIAFFDGRYWGENIQGHISDWISVLEEHETSWDHMKVKHFQQKLQTLRGNLFIFVFSGTWGCWRGLLEFSYRNSRVWLRVVN